MKINIKNITEITLLIIFVITFSWIGIGNIFERNISHDYPRGMLASDPFHYYHHMEGYDERGIFDYSPYYISYNKSNVIAFQPPLYHIDSVLLGNMIDIENYDSMNLIMLFMLVNGVLLMYFILKKLDWKIGILSLPLIFFIFIPNFIFGILWGRQPTMFTEIFLVGIFWAMLNVDKKLIWIILGVFLAGLAMGHTPQLLFGVTYIAIYYVHKIIRSKRFPKELTLNLIKTAFVSITISAYYLILFKNTIAKASPFHFHMLTAATTGNRYASFFDFKLAAIPLIVGIIIFLFLKNKQSLMPSFFMLIVGLTNYFLGKRGIETRFMWPIFLSGFFGLTLYYLILTLKKQKSLIIISFIFLASSIFLISSYYRADLGKGSLANSYNWEALTFISKNTPERSKIFFGYGDVYDQKAFLGQTKRLSYAVSQENWIESLQSRKIRKNYTTTLIGEGGKAAYISENGDIKFYLDEFKPTATRDICSYDYYVFNKFGRIQQLAQFNLITVDYLLKNNYAEKFFENELVLILKNNKPSSDCVPKEGIIYET